MASPPTDWLSIPQYFEVAVTFKRLFYKSLSKLLQLNSSILSFRLEQRQIESFDTLFLDFSSFS